MIWGVGRFRLQTLLHLVALCCAGCAAWLTVPESAPLRRTHRPLDVAIVGRGYFQVANLETGQIQYTREGRFSIDNNSTLTLANGWPIDPAINIPSNYAEIRVRPDGYVSVSLSDEFDVQVGQVQLAYFINDEKLDDLGSGLFAQTEASGSPITATPCQGGAGTLQQGWLEAPLTVIENTSRHAPLVLTVIVFTLLTCNAIGYRRV